jgi:mono/diheme cytochrome c family protein
MKATAAVPAVTLAFLALTVKPHRLDADQRGAAPPADAIARLKGEGQVVYHRECAPCHGADGTGDGAGPPLAGDAALADTTFVIRRILNGTRDRGMDGFAASLTDREIAAVATFIDTAWDNAGAVVQDVDVVPLRLPPRR